MCSLLPLTLHFLYAVFSAELEKWRSPEFYEREVHRMQLPFSSKVPGGCVSVEERQERRAQQLRRLQEINARRREEKLQQDQERLDRLLAVQARTLLDLLKFTSTRVVSLMADSCLYYQSACLFLSSFSIFLNAYLSIFQWNCHQEVWILFLGRYMHAYL